MDDAELLQPYLGTSKARDECSFLLDLMEALLAGPAPAPEVARRVGHRLGDVLPVFDRLNGLEGPGLVTHKSEISGQGLLTRTYALTPTGREVAMKREPDRKCETGGYCRPPA